ncbi:DUF4224 domain-containing protein [Devosia sp.]|uniref:DUF4224 domain-containing protein n=1 Tax=Devosia sp. TaxID=1871048 RepID=UPI002FCBAE01
MFLSASEVAEMTGRTRPTAQVRWLTDQKFAFIIGADGRPKVLKAVALARLGGKEETKTSGPQVRWG